MLEFSSVGTWAGIWLITVASNQTLKELAGCMKVPVKEWVVTKAVIWNFTMFFWELWLLYIYIYKRELGSLILWEPWLWTLRTSMITARVCSGFQHGGLRNVARTGLANSGGQGQRRRILQSESSGLPYVINVKYGHLRTPYIRLLYAVCTEKGWRPGGGVGRAGCPLWHPSFALWLTPRGLGFGALPSPHGVGP